MQQPLPVLSKQVETPRPSPSSRAGRLAATVLVCAFLGGFAAYSLALYMQDVVEDYIGAMTGFVGGHHAYADAPTHARLADDLVENSAAEPRQHDGCEDLMLGRTFAAETVYSEDVRVSGVIVAFIADLSPERLVIRVDQDGDFDCGTCVVTSSYRVSVDGFSGYMAVLRLHAPALVPERHCPDGTIAVMHRDLLRENVLPACAPREPRVYVDRMPMCYARLD